MNVFVERGRHHSATGTLFAGLDVFLREDLLRCLHGDEWTSILCVDGRAAMLHAMVPVPIPGTPWFDIEPFYGYAGPVFSDTNESFVRRAFAAYAEYCRDQRIVCELFRFQPDRQNHLPLRDVSGLSLYQGRGIAYVAIAAEEEAQRRAYSPACRRQIKKAERDVEVRCLEGELGWREFGQLYRRSLERNGAAVRWFLTDAELERHRRSGCVRLFGAFRGDALLSAVWVCEGAGVVHTLFVANAAPTKLDGAHDLLTHRVARAYPNHRWLCLGGGRTAAPDDPLLAFKRKFAGSNVMPLPLGFAPYLPDVFQKLNVAASEDDVLASARLAASQLPGRLMPYRLVRRFANERAYRLDAVQ